MLQIYCPYCDEIREEDEFHYAGEAHIVRPLEPEAVTDEEWGNYLFHRKITKARIRKCGRTVRGVVSFLMLYAIQ